MWRYLLGQENTEEVRAIKKIRKGEEISSSYIISIGDTLWGKRNFDCLCGLCLATDQETGGGGRF